MKEFSQETINIGGVDYTLFLNRRGIIAWENITKAKRNKSRLEETVKDINQDIEIKEGDNPFEIAKVDEVLSAEDETMEYYDKLYWIMLYENHKLDYSKVKELFKQAVEEYGIEALCELAIQMIEDANRNMNENKELKKLAALRPKKN